MYVWVKMSTESRGLGPLKLGLQGAARHWVWVLGSGSSVRPAYALNLWETLSATKAQRVSFHGVCGHRHLSHRFLTRPMGRRTGRVRGQGLEWYKVFWKGQDRGTHGLSSYGCLRRSKSINRPAWWGEGHLKPHPWLRRSCSWWPLQKGQLPLRLWLQAGGPHSSDGPALVFKDKGRANWT